MKAICRLDNGTFIRSLAEVSTLRKDWVRLKILYVGICKTDIAVAEGKLAVDTPMILGHEASAEVVGLGAGVHNFNLGDLVSIIPMSPCGSCMSCTKSMYDLCHSPAFAGLKVAGYLREYVEVPQRYLYAYPKSIDPILVAYTEPVAAALAVLNYPYLLQGNGLILGHNRFGKLIEFIMRVHQYTNISISQQIPQGCTYDYVIETGLRPYQFDHVLAAINKGGSFILRSRSNQQLNFNAKLLIEQQLRIQGVSYARYAVAILFIQKHALELMNFVGDVFDFYDFEHALRYSKKHTAFKNFIKVGSLCVE